MENEPKSKCYECLQEFPDSELYELHVTDIDDMIYVCEKCLDVMVDNEN